MTRRTTLWATVSAVLVSALGVRAELPPLIPRALLFGNPDKVSPRISPDGQRLAYIAPDQDVLNLWVRTVGAQDDRCITKDRLRGIRHYFWAQNNRHLLYIQDKGGDENWHLYAVDPATGVERDLTQLPDVQARVLAVDHKFPNTVLVAINDRDPKLHDVYRINLVSGSRTLVAENSEGVAGWLADHNLKVRAAAKSDLKGGFDLLVREEPESAWRTLTSWGTEDSLNSRPIGFTPDGRGLYVLNSAGSNTTELRRMDLATGQEKVLTRDNTYDVGSVMRHPTRYNVQAVSFIKDRQTWKVLDPAIKADMEAIRGVHAGDFSVINRDNADRRWLVAFDVDNGPVRYYSYDRQAKSAELLFTNRQALENVTLAEMKPISFKASDGLTIHGYLTTPPGVAASSLPMVLLVHGGPWARDTWGYDAKAQWLANRGYAVLQVNFRGSRGYGKDFINAANREWGGKMHDDLIDGVQWAVDKGIADAGRVAIFGGSYGGYATLVGLTTTPKVFRCGVDIVGPSNLISFMKNVPPYWKPWESIWWTRVGHPDKDADFLRSRSPLFKIDRIEAPLLIAQGANDPRVKVSESRQMVEAMRKAGKSVEYVEYADEGHGFARPENRMDFYAKAERFLADHLGGRYEQ